MINTMDISKRGEELLISGSDDGYIGIWDPRTKTAVDFIQTEFPVTAVALAEAGNELYSGGIDNDIKVWDMRRKAVVYSMLGHTDTISSLRVSPDSQTLLSNSMDSTVRTWDIRPFAPTERHIRTFDGAPAGMEKNLIKASWNSDGKKVAAGAGDGTVVVWNSETGKLMYKLPGHKGTVNCAELSPSSDPISEYSRLKLEYPRTNDIHSSIWFFRSDTSSGRAQVRFTVALNVLEGLSGTSGSFIPWCFWPKMSDFQTSPHYRIWLFCKQAKVMGPAVEKKGLLMDWWNIIESWRFVLRTAPLWLSDEGLAEDRHESTRISIHALQDLPPLRISLVKE